MTGWSPDGAAVPPHGGPLLAFLADGQEYALSMTRLVEVIRYRSPTRVPGAEEAIEGILPHRGRMVTLVDLRRRLGLPARPPGAAAHVIVATVDDEWHGLVVDAVLRVVTGHDRVVDLESVVGRAP